LINLFRENVPAPVKGALRRMAYFVLEASAALSGKDDFTPPGWIPLIGDGDFKGVGEEFFRYFVEWGGLRPDEAVLDVGCGLGRMARPLTRYLDPARGRYSGFDIDDRAIRWCQRRISARHPHFHFQYADLFSREYHLAGKANGAAYRFPYPDAAFDFVISTSVFTHMLPPEVKNYLGEFARVLRPGGRSLMTFFLLNPESSALLDAGRSPLNLAHNHGAYRLLNERIPEAAVAHDESAVRAWLRSHNLRLLEPIRYGGWCGREKHQSYQDLLLVTKPKSVESV
jgi:SAM-dependent methyltransferase